MTSRPGKIRVGTRQSKLARAQTNMVVGELRSNWPGVDFEIVPLSTTGDCIQDKPLYAFGGKGVFTKELEEALLSRGIDIAIHSMKDVPVTMPLVEGKFEIMTVLDREQASDVLIVRDASVKSLSELPTNAIVGTSSVRRSAQLMHHRVDLQCAALRGNVDTRLNKLREGQYHAIVLAKAGLNRLFGIGLGANLDGLGAMELDEEEFIPAAGQGALAVQFLEGDSHLRSIVSSISQSEVEACVKLEREVVRRLNGDCHSPIGVYATIIKDDVTVRAMVAGSGGVLPIKTARVAGKVSDSNALLDQLLGQISSLG
jgi:hydroxymethylbilane synthase